MPTDEITNTLEGLTKFEKDLVKKLFNDSLNLKSTYDYLTQVEKKKAFLDVLKKLLEELKAPHRIKVYNSLLAEKITDEDDPSVAEKFDKVIDSLEADIETLEDVIKTEEEREIVAQKNASDSAARKFKIINANAELEKEVKEQLGRGLKSESEAKDELEPAKSNVSFANEPQVKHFKDDELVSEEPLIERQPTKSILKAVKPVVQKAEPTFIPVVTSSQTQSKVSTLASKATSSTQSQAKKSTLAPVSTPFGKGFFARVNAYRKANPVKFGLILGAITLGAVALIGAIAATGFGAAALAAAGTAGAAAAAATGATGVTAGLSSLFGTGITASAAASTLFTVGAGLAVAGAAATAVGVAALGYTSHKAAYEALNQATINKIKNETKPSVQTVENKTEVKKAIKKLGPNAEAEKEPRLIEEIEEDEQDVIEKVTTSKPSAEAEKEPRLIEEDEFQEKTAESENQISQVIETKSPTVQIQPAEQSENKLDNQPKIAQVVNNAVKIATANPTYAELNQIYSESTTTLYGNHKVTLGGVRYPSAWANFVTDDKSFAEFISNKSFSGDSPWKMHLSIQPDDLSKAWDLMYPMLAEMSCNFKVSRLAIIADKNEKIQTATNIEISDEEKRSALMDGDRLTKGMQITVYIPEGQEAAYQALAERIESKLNAAGVRAGEIHSSDRALGSYISVRNDVRNGKYVPHDQAIEYKDPNQVDPFFKIGEKQNRIITEQYNPFYEKLKSNPKYGEHVNNFHNKTLALINSFEYLTPSTVNISDKQYDELVKQGDKLFEEFIEVSNKVKSNVSEITNLGFNVSLLSFYGDDFTKKLQHIEKELDAVCKRQLELAGNNEDAKNLATEAAKQLEELKSVLGDKYTNPPLYLDTLTATEITAVQKALHAIHNVALAVASIDANFNTYNAFINECIAIVDLNTPENRNLVATRLPVLSNYLANPQQHRKELVDLHEQQLAALNAFKADNNDLTQYAGFLNEAAASVSNAIKYLNKSLKPLFILLEDLGDKSKIIYEDANFKIVPTSVSGIGTKGVSSETTAAFKKILDMIEIAAKDDPILAAKLFDKFITTNWTRNVLKNNPDETLNKRVLALMNQLIHLEKLETFVLLKKLNVPFNPTKKPSPEAIKQINAGNFSSIEAMTFLLKEAGFNIEGLSYRNQKYLLAVITKGNFLNKIDNFALRNILNQKPEVIFYDEITNQLIGEDCIDEINNLTTNGTTYSSYYKQLTEILGKKIVLTRDEYNDICAREVCDQLQKQKIPIITDFSAAFKTLQNNLAATEKLIRDIDTKYRIPLYEKFKKLMSQKQTFSLKDLVVFINEELPAYREQIQNMIALRIVAASTDKTLLKNLLGDTVANNFEAFIKQHTSHIDALQHFLSTEIDVLLKNNLAFFIKEIANEIKQASKYFTSELKDALLNRLQEINGFMLILQNYFGVNSVQVAKLRELADSINNLKSTPAQDIDMVELEELQPKDEVVTVSIIPSATISTTALPNISLTTLEAPTTTTTEIAEDKAVTEASFESEAKEVKTEAFIPLEVQPLLEPSSSVIQVLPNENKLVTPYNANGLSYELKSTGISEYKRPNNYSMRSDEAKRGYSDDEKKVLLHMTINSIANLIKQGETKFTVNGSEQLCKKVGRNILAICKLANIPDAEVYINGSDKPYKPGIPSRKEIKCKYEILKKRGMTAASITEADIENIIEVPYKRSTPGSAA